MSLPTNVPAPKSTTQLEPAPPSEKGVQDAFVRWLAGLSDEEVASNPAKIWRQLGEHAVLPLCEGSTVKALMYHIAVCAAGLRAVFKP